MLQGHTELLDAARETTPASPYRYFVYGMSLHSEIPLALPEHGYGELGQIELRAALASCFSEAVRSLRAQPPSESFYQFAGMRDGSSYVRWEGVGEFLISADGGRIASRQFDEADAESFKVYLLGQALSFALVKQGFEPLHATTVVVNGKAVVLLGNSGFGKSSLAACFLAAGHSVLTDDLLVLQSSGNGFLAHPGPPRIKLFPKLARRFLGHAANGVAMNSGTKKLILRLEPAHSCAVPVPLGAIYALVAPRDVSRKQAIRIAVLPAPGKFHGAGAEYVQLAHRSLRPAGAAVRTNRTRGQHHAGKKSVVSAGPGPTSRSSRRNFARLERERPAGSMRRLKRFAQLPPSERRLLMRVLIVVGVARTSLWVMPVEAARRAVSRAAAGAAGNSVEQVVWAVKVVSRYLPGATCLTQAIAAQALLTHSGFPSQVEIGVAKERKDGRDNATAKTEDEARGFHAHAWVVCKGQVVLGGRQVERYNSLMVWDQ